MAAKLIVFEGRDGVGKTSLVKATAEVLENLGKKVLVTREPGGAPRTGQMFRDIIFTGELTPDAELLCFLADRVDHLHKVVIPGLALYDYVLCDRYIWSTFAYQSKNHDLAFLDSLVRRFSSVNQLMVMPYAVIHVKASHAAAEARKGNGHVDVNHFDLAGSQELSRREYVMENMLEKYQEEFELRLMEVINEEQGINGFHAAVEQIMQGFLSPQDFEAFRQAENGVPASRMYGTPKLYIQTNKE